MAPLSTPKLVLRRIRDDKMLLSSIFVGIVFAATLVAAVPIYINSLERLALNIEIDRLGRFQSKVLGFAFNIPVTEGQFAQTDQAFNETVVEALGDVYANHERYVTGLQFYAGMPDIPLPRPGQENASAARVYLRSRSHFDEHVRVIDGRLPQVRPETDGRGATLEAVIGATTASRFRLRVGDLLRVTPDASSPKIMTVTIVCVVDAAVPEADYSLI